MREVERNIVRNPSLDDGTPRRAKGYRPHVCTLGPDDCLWNGWMGRLQKRWWVGPVLPTEAAALAWFPDEDVQRTALEDDAARRRMRMPA